MNNFTHIPVLKNEIIELLFNNEVINEPIIVDCTVGLGGHARLILEKLNHHGFLYGFDIDEKAVKLAQNILKKSGYTNYKLVCKSFTEVKNYLVGKGILEIDKAIFDLGLSSMQIDDLERGFSYNQNCLLDMRMTLTQKKDAKYILNKFSEQQLLKVLQKYGVRRFAKKIVNEIIIYRRKKLIETSFQLNEIIKKTIFGANFQIKKYQKLVYQALRLEVNHELEVFEKGLKVIWELLKKGGILLVITFHSLEDKVLKQFFNQIKLDPKVHKLPINDLDHLKKFEMISKKAFIPSLKEVTTNKRASSAKLWAYKKLSKLSK